MAVCCYRRCKSPRGRIFVRFGEQGLKSRYALNRFFRRGIGMRSLIRCLWVAFTLVSAGPLQGAFITSAASMSNNSKLIDFSQFSSTIVNAGASTWQIGAMVSEDVTWQSTNSGSVIVGNNGSYWLGNNGSWSGWGPNGSGRNGFVGSSFNATMTFRFLGAQWHK